MDVRKAEAHVLELVDPANAGERIRTVQSVAALGPRERTKEAQLLIKVNRAHRLAGISGQIADLEKLFGVCRWASRGRTNAGFFRGLVVEEAEANVIGHSV